MRRQQRSEPCWSKPSDYELSSSQKCSRNTRLGRRVRSLFGRCRAPELERRANGKTKVRHAYPEHLQEVCLRHLRCSHASVRISSKLFRNAFIASRSICPCASSDMSSGSHHFSIAAPNAVRARGSSVSQGIHAPACRFVDGHMICVSQVYNPQWFKVRRDMVSRHKYQRLCVKSAKLPCISD